MSQGRVTGHTVDDRRQLAKGNPRENETKTKLILENSEPPESIVFLLVASFKIKPVCHQATTWSLESPVTVSSVHCLFSLPRGQTGLATLCARRHP